MDITPILSGGALVLTSIGGMYLFGRDIKNDIKKDIEAFEKRMEVSDARWERLLSEMHRVDKDVHLLKGKNK